MIALLLACVEEPPEAEAPSAWYAPDAAGPWIAGTEDDVFAGPGDATQPVQVWFPASEAGDDPYAYGDGLLEGTAREDAVPDCAEARPVLVFSHGNGAMGWQSIFLTEHLATHGWVVVAPDHVGNTIWDSGAPLGDMALRRPLDVAAAFDWLAETDADGLLAGCVDPDAGYAVAGHSFGGYTTVAVAGATLDAGASAAWCAEHDDWLCEEFADAMTAAGETAVSLGDPRAWAAVPMAPAGHEVLVGGLADVAIPMLVLGGSLDTMTPVATQAGAIYGGLAVAPRALGTVDGAGHFAFSDACAIVSTYEDCHPPYRPDAETHPVISTAVTAFLRWVAGDTDAAAWLPDPDEEILAWEEVE
ncbi:MAG: alpha/beta hydrolase family protein [Myxococcota bacterium]